MSVLALSRDAQAIALLCSRLALPREGGPKPFGPAEWNRLAARLRSTDFGRPGDLVGREPPELVEALAIAPDQAERVHALLSRGGQLAIEAERLASRGIWILTRADDEYPHRLKQRLRGDAPPLFYGAGPRSLLDAGGVAVVGSRDADKEALVFAHDIGRVCARERTPVVSGAARGVDITAMLGALDSGGNAIGIAAEALERLIRRRELREHLAEGTVVLISPQHPSARVHAGNAMRRNRLIYCAADVAVVVASAPERGGTRAGAVEALDAHWVPVLVRDDRSPGNEALLRRGAHPLLDAERVLQAPHHGHLGSLLDVADAPDAETMAAPEPTPGPPAATEPQTPPESHGDPSDLFATVWPRLAAYLVEPRKESELAEHFDLRRTQARAWLERALAEGLIERKGRTRLFVRADRQQVLTPP
jgi:predicted Rossmann fold nucleotide-binding protein DprA/Smf involved in DNA uptake